MLVKIPDICPVDDNFGEIPDICPADNHQRNEVLEEAETVLVPLPI